MGAALEVVTSYLSQSDPVGGTYYALTANSPSSFTIRQASGTPAGQILAPWGQFDDAGYLQIKSPRLHDTTIGTTNQVRIYSNAFAVEPLWGLDQDEPAYSTDVLTVDVAVPSTITATVVFSAAFPVYYSNLPGVDANFMTWAQVQSYINPVNKTGLHYVSWVSPSTAGTKGQIGAGALINSVNDQFKAGHFYALLGYITDTQVTSVLLSGTDTGNLNVGGPGTLDVRQTRDWFVKLSVEQNLPLIPVIQANNKGTTYVYLQDSRTTSTQVTVGLIWMDLGILNAPVGV